MKKDREESNNRRNQNARVVAADGVEAKKALTDDQKNDLRGYDNTPDRIENESYKDLDNEDEEIKKVSRQFRYLRNNS